MSLVVDPQNPAIRDLSRYSSSCYLSKRKLGKCCCWRIPVAKLLLNLKVAIKTSMDTLVVVKVVLELVAVVAIVEEAVVVV